MTLQNISTELMQNTCCCWLIYRSLILPNRVLFYVDKTIRLDGIIVLPIGTQLSILTYVWQILSCLFQWVILFSKCQQLTWLVQNTLTCSQSVLSLNWVWQFSKAAKKIHLLYTHYNTTSKSSLKLMLNPISASVTLDILDELDRYSNPNWKTLSGTELTGFIHFHPHDQAFHHPEEV